MPATVLGHGDPTGPKVTDFFLQVGLQANEQTAKQHVIDDVAEGKHRMLWKSKGGQREINFVLEYFLE